MKSRDIVPIGVAGLFVLLLSPRLICVTDEEAASRAEPVGFVGSCARLAADPTVPRPKTAAALERSEQRVDVLDGADEEFGVVELGLAAVAPSYESSADAQWTRALDVVVAVAHH